MPVGCLQAEFGVVEVIDIGGHQDIKAIVGEIAGIGHVAPEVVDRAFVDRLAVDVVPEDGSAALFDEEGGDLVLEGDLDIDPVLGADLFLQRLHVGARIPLFREDLVAANMDLLRGEQGEDFLQDILAELDGFRAAHAQGGAAFAAAAFLTGHQRRPAIGRREFGIRCAGRRHVSGHVDLGNDPDVAGGGIGDNLTDLVLRVETAITAVLAVFGILLRAGDRMPGANFGEFRILLDLDAPAVVVGEMPVEDIELQKGHFVQTGLDLIPVEKMPGNIKHEAAPGDPGRILDADTGDLFVRHQLPDRLAAIEGPGRRGGGDGRALRGNLERVAFGRQAIDFLEHDARSGCPDRQAQCRGQQRRLIGKGRIRLDRRLVGQRE